MENSTVPIIAQETPHKLTWKDHLINAIRQVIVGCVISGAVLGALIVGFAGQNAAERQRELDTLHANLAIACELALPIAPAGGRSEKRVAECFTQYGLQPPSFPE